MSTPLINIEQGEDPTSDSPVDGSVPTGKDVFGLQWQITGVSASGESLAPAQIGEVTVELYERKQIQVPLDFTHYWTRKHRGNVEQTNPTAGSTLIQGMVPMFYAGAPQTLPTINKSSIGYTFEFKESSLSTIFDTGTETPEFKLAFKELPGLSPSYIPEFQEQNLPFQSANTLSADLDNSNYTHLYVREEFGNNNSEIIDEIEATVDGVQATARVTDEQLDLDNRVLERDYSPSDPYAVLTLVDGNGVDNVDSVLRVTSNASGKVNVIHSRRLSFQQAGVQSLFEGR